MCKYIVKNYRKNLNKFAYTIGIGIIIDVVSSVIYAEFKQVDFFTAFKGIWILFFNSIKKILLFNIKVWQILVFATILFLIISILLRTKKKKITKPEFMKYTSDVYKGINYKWKLDDYAGELRITYLEPVCKCGAFLTRKNSINDMYYGTEKLYCVNCEKPLTEAYNNEIKEDAHLFFINKLNRMIDEYNTTT